MAVWPPYAPQTSTNVADVAVVAFCRTFRNFAHQVLKVRKLSEARASRFFVSHPHAHVHVRVTPLYRRSVISVMSPHRACDLIHQS